MKLKRLWPVERHDLFVLGILGVGLRYGKRLCDLQTSENLQLVSLTDSGLVLRERLRSLSPNRLANHETRYRSR